MMTRRAMACVAAFAAAISVGALGYAVVWAFDVAELAQPAAEPPPPQEAKQPAPRRRTPVIVAPRVPGEDVREVASSAPHAAPLGEVQTAAPIAAPDQPSPLVAVAPLHTLPAPGEDVRAVASSVPHAAPLGETQAAAPIRTGDQLSPLVAAAPPPTPATPGEDAPAIAAWSRVSVAAAVAEQPIPGATALPSELVPQSEANAAPAPAAAPPVQVPPPLPPDREPTGTVSPPTVFRLQPHPVQRPIQHAIPRPAHRAPEDALTPRGITIIRGVPPVPGNSPGIVRPGPLIIHVPSPPRR